jgi:hypothetical protein
MNTNNNQTVQNDGQCCIDYCKTSFNVSGQEVVNNYKCNQRQFSASDMWSIQKQRRQFAVSTAISIN